MEVKLAPVHGHSVPIYPILRFVFLSSACGKLPFPARGLEEPE
jgi:hypothetical protein